MGVLDAFTGKNQKKAAANMASQVVQGANNARTALEGGLDTASGLYGEARDLYRPLYDQGLQGLEMYGNALGLGGAEGNQAAVGAFKTSPGYDFALNQGLQALERRASAQGRLGSGNTALDTLGYAQGLANQEYGNWLDRLSGLGGYATTGAAGQSGALGSEAAANLSTAGSLADLSYNSALAQGGAMNDYYAANDILGRNAFNLGENILKGGFKLMGYGV